MAAVSLSCVAASLTLAAAPSQLATSQKVPICAYTGLKSSPLQLRRRAAVCRRTAIRSLTVRAAAAPETLKGVREIIATKLSVTEDKVLPESKFADLGADSLDTVEIIMALEEKFELSLDDEGSQKITTVQEAADMIQSSIVQAAA